MATYYGPAVGAFQLRMDVEHTQSIEHNTTTVTENVYLVSAGSIASDGTNAAAAISGQYVASLYGYRSYGVGTHWLMSGARTLTHASDGTLAAFNVSAVMGFPYVDIVLSVGTDYSVPTIPRATVPSWSGNFEAGTAKTISLPRASSGFTHDVQYGFGGSGWVTIATGAGVTTSWTPPLELLEQIPNATSGTGTLRVTTKQGATVIGVTTKQFTLTAPASVVPAVTEVLWDDTNPTVKTNIGAFVQGLSLIKGAVTAAGVHGSTITEKRLRIGETPIPEGTAVQVAGSGTVTAQGEAVDSRGRQGVKAANFTVLAYEPPKLGADGWQVRRANAAGTPTDDGQYLRLDLHAIAKSLVNGTEKNALMIVARTRPVGGAWTARNVISPGLSYNTNVLITGGAVFLAANSYEVEISLADKTGIEATRLLTTIPTATVTIDLNGVKVGIGKFWEQGALDVAGDVYSSGAILSPLGSVTQWLTDTAPTGWLLCQGQAISRTAYAALFALIGTTYGAGNGTTTFNLPDLRGRVPVGKSTDTEFNALGKTAGTKTHTLTTAEMPAHNHASGNNSGHFAFGGEFNASGPASGTGFRTALTSITSGNRGDGGAHNNIQPSYTVHFIIRAI